MLRAYVDAIDSNEFFHWEEFERYESIDPWDDFGTFTVSIGTEGERGTSYFQVLVATHAAARRIMAQDQRAANLNKRNGQFRGLLVDEYTPQTVVKAINDFVTAKTATTWDPILDYLRTIMDWEYEGMGGG